MSLLDDLADWIEAQGVAHGTDPSLTGGWKLAVDVMPEAPDHVVKLGYAGGPGPREKNATVRRPQVQVAVRGDRYGGAAVRAKVEEIFALMHNLPTTVMGGTTVLGVQVFGEVLTLGLDDNRRPQLALNFQTTTGG